MAKRPVAGKTGIDISARMFYAALVCVSKEETRNYLGGVHIEPHPDGGATLVATEGRKMIVLHDPDGHAWRNAIIPAGRELTAALASLHKHGDSEARMLVDKEGVVSLPAAHYRAEKNTLIDGTYPSWAHVIRPMVAAFRRKEAAWASFNPRLLAGFRTVATRLGLNEESSIKIASTGISDPALVLFAGERNAFGALMPMYGDADTGVPAFMSPILSALPRAKRKRLAPVVGGKAKLRRKAHG